MIIDAHVHIGKLENSKFGESYEKNLAYLREEMASAGVDHALILANFDTDEFDPKTEHVLQLVKESGTKNLHIAGSVDMHKVSEGIEKITSFVERKEMVALKLYPGYQHVFPSDKQLYPLYESCSQVGIPVIFHSGDTLNYAAVRGKVRYSHPIHIDDVAVDFPNLTIIIAHMGNPWLIDCAELVYKNKNVYADMSGFFIEENLKDSDYTALISRRIKDFVSYSGSEKLLYGTDWPLAPMGEYIKFVQGLSFSDAELERIFYKNAVELFKLNV